MPWSSGAWALHSDIQCNIVTLSCSLIVMNIKHHNINIGPVNQTMDPADEEESADTADSV